MRNETTNRGEREMTTTTATSRITRVNFTYAITGGMWIEREDGSCNWESFESLNAEHGPEETGRLLAIASPNGMTGMWYNADNGRNVYVNGKEVN